MNPLEERARAMIPGYEEMFAERGGITPSDPLEFHLYHLARYWRRLVGFCRQDPTRAAAFIETDLGACVLAGSEFAYKLIGPDSDIFEQWQDCWKQTQAILHKRPVTIEDVEASSHAFDRVLAEMQYDPWPQEIIPPRKPKVLFERPFFRDVATDIQRTFPIPASPSFTLTPDSIDRYLAAAAISLHWEAVPNWERYDHGTRDISDEDFIAMLFSPISPQPDEPVIIITDECIRQKRGLRVPFRKLLLFAREDYPNLWKSHAQFFQPLDMIFFAEQSRFIALLHHEGRTAQYAG